MPVILVLLFILFPLLQTRAQSFNKYVGPCNKEPKLCKSTVKGIKMKEWVLSELVNKPNLCWWTCDSKAGTPLPDSVDDKNSCYDFANQIYAKNKWGSLAKINKDTDLANHSVRFFKYSKLPIVTTISMRPREITGKAKGIAKGKIKDEIIDKILGRQITTYIDENSGNIENPIWVLKINDDRNADSAKGLFEQVFRFKTHGNSCELESINTQFSSKDKEKNIDQTVTPQFCRDSKENKSTDMEQLCTEMEKYFPDFKTTHHDEQTGPTLQDEPIK